MKILSYQPFSLSGTGGGSRILRRLYQGHETQITSLALNSTFSLLPKGNIDEKTINLIPLQRSWMRWIIRDVASWVRDVLLKKLSVQRILNTVSEISCDVIHVVDHGCFSALLCKDTFLVGKILWVSFHDHFSTSGSTFENSNILWNKADRRLVISNELGQEYSRLFGKKVYEIITDGVSIDEISKPILPQKNVITIYFAGLLHIEYLPLFQVLIDSLDILAKNGLKIKLILRGTQHVNFFDKQSFDIEYRPFSINYEELKQELDSATILYLPIKFTVPDFYLYSLSTKMVGYLGGSGSILYHGPNNSAASNILNKFDAAIGCYSLDSNDMSKSIKTLLDKNCAISSNAKKLAKNHFDFDEIKTRFWNE